MSILIKGVDMPIDGKEIHLRIDSHGEVYVYNTYPTMIGNAVDVPAPHGRLIDADALYTELCGRLDEMTDIGIPADASFMWALFNHCLNNALTILEAEE